VLFTFPSRYWFTIGQKRVFSLAEWSPRIQAGFHVPRLTQVPASSPDCFRLRACHALWILFPEDSANNRIGNSTVAGPTTPPTPKCQRFGLFRFRSPLLSESRFLSSPPGTEMVHFPGFALSCLSIQQVVLEVLSSGFPHSDISGYCACVRLPEAFRSLPRPSSPVSAKASTVRP
jgi:hypothetical protein